MLRRFYDKVILQYPITVLLLIIVAIGLLGYQARKLEIDASAETLTLEDDKDLSLSRLYNERFKTQDFLVITFTPQGDLLADETLDTIRKLRADLLKLERVESVNTILDVPLMESPPLPVKEMVKNVPTLESPNIDKTLARKELLSSPIYKNNLVSPDFKSTAILVNLHDDTKWQAFIKQRNALREKEKDGTITAAEQQELDNIIVDFKAYRNLMRDKDHNNILQVRALIKKYSSHAKLFLGGVTMIADDLITFIKNDLSTFGLGVLAFLIITLWTIFRQLRWILLPILCCSFSVIATCGLLGLFDWEVSVISSNFISIQLIITMAMTIHLIVRYRELSEEMPQADQRELILEATLSMAKPCLYAILTTMAGFCSLVLSGIRPVISFGWMMTAGIGVSLILTFLLFPTVLMQMKKILPNRAFESHFTVTKRMADFTEHHGSAIIGVSALILILSIVGSSRLMVENSFIDYFKKTTEIYKGMKMIDQQLGGTTPLDIVIDLEKDDAGKKPAPVAAKKTESGEKDELDEFEEEFKAEGKQAQYWFTSEKMARVEKVHDYLESIPELGKVMSLGTMLKVGKTLNDGKPLDNFLLALIYNELPEQFRKIVLSPFVSVEHDQARFTVRVRDSEPTLRRDALLKRIRQELTTKVGIKPENVHLAGMMVLYNNMLQSLFDSQILTLGAVLLSLMAMFLILFRSFRIALIAIFPNLLSVGVVLGFMGWVGIPLDLMTITIASISVGIAVDDTIHYIHRFKKEFAKDGNYIAAMHRSHESIGYAMYYTSITIIIGFSILILSNFIPGIYFGLLTGLAMVIALIAALTLLPQLIVFLKPLGPDRSLPRT
ncbi:MMPL family transporter [bacterium]|nr:MMPL family transporter [bacterium]